MNKARLIAQLRKDLEGYSDAEHVRLGILRAVEIAWDRAEEDVEEEVDAVKKWIAKMPEEEEEVG